MITWILIALLIVGAIVFIKISHYRHRIFVILIVFVALFLYISVVYVASKNNLDFTTADGAIKSTKIYAGWLFNLAGNFKTLTGSAVKLDWTSTNTTISDLRNVSAIDSKTAGITGRATARFAK